MNSKTAYGCLRYLNEIAERYDIHIVWVPGHSGIPGNCGANELTRWGTTSELSHEFSNLGIPMWTCKLIINNAIVDSVNDRWAALDRGRTVRKIWQRLNEECTASLLKLQRGALSVVVGALHYSCTCEAYWSWIAC